jgi:Asp-tRNA(Asn)/Glu-tRNA(Gln) amidotransferase A subunit family amidase
MPESYRNESPLFWPIVRLKEAYLRGDLSPVEVLEEAILRADEYNPSLNAYLERLDEQARLQARKAESFFMGPSKEIPSLCGIPISIKDTFELKGSFTTYGSAFFRENLTKEDHDLVRRLRLSGAVFTGKTNTPEFAQSATTENRLGDDARNPWNTSYTPGGSSGGAAASVSAGLVTAAIGADGGGSIRIPASFTGLYGFKPTYGLCSYRKGLKAMSDFVAPGPLTRNVGDARIILEVLANCSYFHESLNSQRLRVAWCPMPGKNPVDPQVAKIVKEAVYKLAALGHEIQEIEIPVEGWNKAFDTLVLAEEHRERGYLLEKAPELLTDYEHNSLVAGSKITEENVEMAKQAHREYRQKFQKFFNDFDVLATPVTATTAFTIGKRPLKINEQKVKWLWGAFPFTSPFNVSGNPAASIPCGISGSLPVGLQLVGSWNAEELLLNLSEDLEQAIEFDDSQVRNKWR